ncbi:MAG: endopeptidase La [Bacteroidetes bacterium]|nr:MAG: endopeptidase La [Bacteroidota bacterium]
MNIFDNETLHLNPIIEDDAELIPLLSTEDEEQMNAEKFPQEIPILPLRNTVLFPGVVIPITVGRDKSISLIKDAYKGDKTIGVLAQKNDKTEDPTIDELNKIGTIAFILKMFRMPDGNTTVIIQGKRRFELKELTQTEPYLKAKIGEFKEAKPATGDKEFDALVGSLKDIAQQIIKGSPHIPSEASFAMKNIDSPSFLINFISSNANIPVTEKQKLLEVPNLKERATHLLGHLSKELQMLELKNQIQSKVKVDIDKQQREYFLHQQIKTIQDELGGNSFEQQVEELKKKAKDKKWPKEVATMFEKEIKKLERINPNAAEYSVQTNYLETMVDLPWNEYTTDLFDLRKAQKVLDQDHYGMEKIKERVMEHLAVLKLKSAIEDKKTEKEGKSKTRNGSPILCLVGPPGVGKTSLGKSIASALGRKYVRVSLGGLKDEAEIRGHRRTYIGAMPGRVIKGIQKAKSSNPVFMLDEIDKVGSDYHGDPSSALLEVLDPEQNNSFHDNFIEVDYDLSKVMFIATANTLSTVQPALRDRMEIIEMTGYSVEEKIEIAKRYLIPKQLVENGIIEQPPPAPKREKGDSAPFKVGAKFSISDNVIEKIIENYTRESGVRLLEKMIAKISRHVAKNIAMKTLVKRGKGGLTVTEDNLIAILGPAHPREHYQDAGVPGVVIGLAWTPAGGDILFIETSLSAGKGKLTLTGNLGDVMKESATIALEYLKSHADSLGITADVFANKNIHIHVPEGATPKDGPSAGIAMLTALTSAFTGKKVKKFLAMTGEITLRGRVLPVGGIKEKILAAKRADIKEIILCEENRKDIEDINKDFLKGLTFHYVSNMIDVLAIALPIKKIFAN